MSKQPHLRAYALLVVTTWCWGLNAIIARLAVGEISPMQLVTFRWLGVVLLMIIFCRARVIRDWPILRQHLPFLFVMGCCGFTVFNGLFYVAGHHTTAINIGILQGAIPIFVLLGSLLLLRQRIGHIQWLGVGVGLIGVVAVASNGKLTELLELTINRGDLFMLIACFCYAAYSVGLTHRPKVDAMSFFTMLALVAWIASWPLIGYEVIVDGWQTPTFQGWVLVALVTLFPSFIAQVFFIQGVALIGAGRAGVFVNLVPVFASLMAVLVLGESFELYHALALVLVLGGIGLSEVGKPKQQR